MSTLATSMAAGTAHLGERLHALLDRELSPQDEAVARAHLDACPSCATEHQKLAGAVAALHGLGRARAPEGFASRILRRARFQRAGRSLRALSDHKVQYEGAIIVIVAAAIAATILITYEARAGGGLFARNDAKASAVSPATRP